MERGFVYNQVMSAAFSLFRLQQVDSRIMRIEAQLAKIRETLSNDAELRAVMDEVQAAEVEQADSEHTRRKSEEDAQSLQIKIQQAESSLYGGLVKNPKELQDLQADIVSLKKHLATLEERELEAMARVETADSNLSSAQEKMKQIQARLGSEHKKLLEEQAALSSDLGNMSRERQAAVSAVAQEMLAAYNELRQEKRGVAVAEISDNACGACGTTLTAALQQNARHTAQLIHCPSCGRILYAG